MNLTNTQKKQHLRIVLITLFLDMVGIGILIPVLPTLFINSSDPHYILTGSLMLYGALIQGIVSSIYPLMQFVSGPFIGDFSDSLGRKKILEFCIAGIAVGYILFGIGVLIQNVYLVFFSRIISGLFSGNVSTIQASISDISTPEERAKNFGLVGAAFGMGFIVGPVLGGVLSNSDISKFFSPSTPFFFAAGLAILNFILVKKYFVETNSVRKKVTLRITQSIIHIYDAFTGNMRFVFITNFIYSLGFATYTSLVTILLSSKLGRTESQIGFFFGFIGVCIVCTQLFVVRNLAKRFRPEQILGYSLLGVSLTIFAYAISREMMYVYAAGMCMALAVGTTNANLQAFVSALGDQKSQGRILGINSSVFSLAGAISGLLAGSVAQVFGVRAGIGLAASIVAIAWMFFIYYLAPKKAFQS